MKIIISFDSEDFVTPEAANAELWWAQMLRERNLTGHFQLVGEMVRELKRTGRQDVIDAVGEHEIGYHSNFHSAPPTHPALVEKMSFEQAVAAVLKAEAPGWSDVIATFGRVPFSYSCPGDSWTPASLLVMAMLGVKTVCNIHQFRADCVAPWWFCGNMIFKYDMCFDSYFTRDEADFKDDFEQTVRRLTAQGGDVLTIFAHPCRLVTANFWDALFMRGSNPPREQWTPAPLRSEREITGLKDRYQRILDYLQSRGDLTLTGYKNIYDEYSTRSCPRDLPSLLRQASLLPGQEHGLATYQPQGNTFLAPSDIDSFKYGWGIYPAGFCGENSLSHARSLAWTAAPSGR